MLKSLLKWRLHSFNLLSGVFFFWRCFPSMVRYSILKSNNLENEFFFLLFSIRTGLPFPSSNTKKKAFKLIWKSFFFDFNILIFHSSYVVLLIDIKKRRSKNVKSIQYMYEIKKPPIDVGSNVKRGRQR